VTESELASVIQGLVPVLREHITKGLADVTARVISAEARLGVLGDLRDRVVAMETKAAMPVPEDPGLGELRERLMHVATLQERVASLETKHPLDALTVLHERVAVVESKAAEVIAPSPEAVDLSPVLERLAAVDARMEPLDGLRDRVIALETRDRVITFDSKAVPDMTLVEARIAPLQERQKSIEEELAHARPSIAAVQSGRLLETIAKDLGPIKDRLAAVELKGLIQGPPGPAGKDGKDGRDGRDGADGMTLDDLTVEQERERTAVFRGKSGGGQVRELGRMSFPFQIYRDVWRAGNTYERGDCVTRDGSQWHCNVPSTTATPGDGSKDWTLVVKKGRDGRDLRDALPPATLPVVRAGGSS